MAYAKPSTSDRISMHVDAAPPRKPRILLAACGSVAALKFGTLCRCFTEWAEVRAVVTEASLHFIDTNSLPDNIVYYTDADEWSLWKQVGDSVLHIELAQWADVMVIAPLSAHTLGKIAGGLCDNLLTSIVRAWEYRNGKPIKPIFVATAMNTLMWQNSFTEKHLHTIDELGMSLILPVTNRLDAGDHGKGAMAEPSLIYSTVRIYMESKVKTGSLKRQLDR
ncbi:Phosphopantothenoylcysteine decarboxylase [Quillaja saponaria]|uniref:phosphopantothenoylcysteine decarboxylase n=1 Tax=Quillaja saponaria TaxID=32244 RepID=A0AAD7M050_QUISA|nr:Phosphopantothenoylcysteine decarboxylase [Quillaja saponaria]